jgi:Holliday junction resolvase RusA-like endonuclease
VDDDYPYEGPGGDGTLQFGIDIEPVSLQSRVSARQAFDDALARTLGEFDFVIDSQVTLTVHWYGVPHIRWQTDRYPDLDNWLKPLLDAFVGADRLLVDDSLIRSVELTWHEGYVAQSRIEVRLDFDADHRLPKAGLRYAQFDRGLCFPVPGDLKPEAVAVWLRSAQSSLETLRELENLEIHSISTWGLLSNGWVHRSRLGSSFTVVPAAHLLG